MTPDASSSRTGMPQNSLREARVGRAYRYCTVLVPPTHHDEYCTSSVVSPPTHAGGGIHFCNAHGNIDYRYRVHECLLQTRLASNIDKSYHRHFFQTP